MNNKYVEIINMNKKFNNQKIFSNINYCFSDTGLYGLIGQSGIGKSTLLYILGLLDNEYEGNIKINNQDIKKIKDKQKFIHENIGFMFQSSIFFTTLTVKENLNLFVNKKSEIEINSLLKRFSLFHKSNDLVCNLSGGERARLNLLRGVLNSPSILLCDEPTASLDETNSFEIMNFLKEEAKKRLVIVVSHKKQLMESYCDVLLEIDNFNINEVFLNSIKDKENKRPSNGNNRLKLSFFFSYFEMLFNRKKINSFFCIFALFISLFIVGFSFLLSDEVGLKIKESFSSLKDENQILLKINNENISQEEISINEEDALNIIDNSNCFYDFGYIYYGDFENQFIDDNYMSLLNGESSLTLFEFGVRKINETVLLDDVPSNYKFYPKKYTNLSNDEFVLGLRKKDVRKICASFGYLNNDEETLSNHLINNEIEFCFFISNNNWGYRREIKIKMKAFFITDTPLIAHSSNDFVVDFFENKMNLPVSNDLKRIEYYPWTLKKALYLKCDRLSKMKAIEEYLSSFYYKHYDFKILKGDEISFLFSSLFHEGKFIITYAKQNKICYSDLNILKENKLINNFLPLSSFYQVIEEQLISGFSNSLIVSSDYEHIQESEIYFQEINENIDYIDLSSINFSEDVICSNLLTSAFKKGLKISCNLNGIDYGRLPENENEIVISSSLKEKLFKNDNPLNKDIYISINYYSNVFGNSFVSNKVKVVGIKQYEKDRIYQSPYWYCKYICFYLDYPLEQLQFSSFLCESDFDVDILNDLDVGFLFLDPSKEINKSVDNILSMIELILLIFSIVFVISSLGVLFVTNANVMKSSYKEIGLLKSLGANDFSIFSLYFSYNLIYFILSYLIACFSLYVCFKMIDIYYFMNSFSFSINIKPFILMFHLGFIISVPMCLLQTFFPLKENPVKLLKRYY